MGIAGMNTAAASLKRRIKLLDGWAVLRCGVERLAMSQHVSPVGMRVNHRVKWE
jgi:hypothetical protein